MCKPVNIGWFAHLESSSDFIIIRAPTTKWRSLYEIRGKTTNRSCLGKAMLTVDEAVAYSGIGRDKLIELAERESSLILWVGSKRLFKRKKLDEIIENAHSI